MKPLHTAIKPLFVTGAIAGTLDGIAAIALYTSKTGKDPMNVFRFIASGVFGSTAFSGGLPMAIAGIAFHYVIAFGWTLLFFIVAARITILTRNWVVSGVMYGVVIWLGMNLVVVPVSRVPSGSGPQHWAGILQAMVVLIVCVGLPVAYAAKKVLEKARPKSS